MNTTSIEFKELSKYTDSNSIVFIGVIIQESDYKEVDKLLREINLIPDGKSVIGIHHISDNVLGTDGRSDYLLELDHPELPIDPMSRLLHSDDFKWTSDFITNYKDDYVSGRL